MVTKAHLLTVHPTSAVLSIRLVALKVNGQRIEASTNQLDSKGASHAKRDAAIGAGTGAGVGAIFGGAIGAAIGAGAGAVGGLVLDKLTGRVVIPSETQFTYTLPAPLVISYQGGGR